MLFNLLFVSIHGGPYKPFLRVIIHTQQGGNIQKEPDNHRCNDVVDFIIHMPRTGFHLTRFYEAECPSKNSGKL